jgi:hypothetical protein
VIKLVKYMLVCVGFGHGNNNNVLHANLYTIQ